MKNLLAPAILAFALAAPAAAETRDHTGFTGVAAADRLRVEVSEGPRYSVQVEGRDASRVRTRIDDSTLRISERNRSWFGRSRALDAVVRVTAPNIDSLAAARGAELRAENLQADDLAIAAAMGAELWVSGTCDDLDAAASMGAIIHADNMACSSADIAASMGAEARVNVATTFDAAASMGAVINVAGGAQRGDVATSMGAEVNQSR